MAISSGRCRIPVMQHPKEFFCISKPFWYTPISDKNVHTLIEAAPCENVIPKGDGWSLLDCEKYCAIYKWCAVPGNFDWNGTQYIPCCHYYEREDAMDVFFKEIS
jgi:hypothetical protein